LTENETSYIIKNFEDQSKDKSFSVEIKGRNPLRASNYVINIFSFSPKFNAKIDEAFINISIGNKCNPFLDMFLKKTR